MRVPYWRIGIVAVGVGVLISCVLLIHYVWPTFAFPTATPAAVLGVLPSEIAKVTSSAHSPFRERPFSYTFNSPGMLMEAASPTKSSSPYWWLDSGALFMVGDGMGTTIQGDLGATDPWRIRYGLANPLDTDNGYHPQNIFRLVSRTLWNDATVSALFRIDADRLSESPNRNESNGILLMARYQDAGQTLYYAGIRVDGTAVIKKKFHGTYYTLAQMPIRQGTYDRTRAPDLLPQKTWMVLSFTTVAEPDGSVALTLTGSGDGLPSPPFELTARDTGQYAMTAPLTGPANVGIRTDFMDVSMKSVRIDPIFMN